MTYKSYTLENDLLEVKVTDLGATLLSFKRKDINLNAVLAFENIEDYLKYQETYLNAIVGRNTNRIAEGHFRLNNIDYYLEKNNYQNNLHSGSNTTAFKKFNVINHTSDTITFEYFEEDMSNGFPGDFNLLLCYKLEDSSLRLSFKAKSNKDTIFNMTSHAYFNLDGGIKNVLDEELYIPTDKMNINDEFGLAKNEVMNIKDTAFDFSKYTKIGDNIAKGHPNMKIGIDHNYLFETLEDKLLCSLRNDSQVLNIYSDLPDLQVYTCNFFTGYKGKGAIYDKYQAVALECQYCPNAINYEEFLKPIIKAGEEVEHHIVYQLEKR